MAGFLDLYKAALLQDHARLRQLVRGGADINCRDSKKRTVLHYVAAFLWVDGPTKDVIKTLVDLGADINASDIQRKTPLHYFLSMQSCVAIFSAGGVKALAFLISLGADINAKFDRETTSLHRAIQLQNIRGIETLLRLGVDVNAYMMNFTVINLALDMTRMTLLENLVKLGADIDSVGTILPPLLQAIELGRLDIVKLLVQYGADVNDIRCNQTPVCTAVERRNPHVLKSLVQLGADLNGNAMSSSSSVNEIVKVGRVDILEYLVRYGADIRYRPGFHQVTALRQAVDLDSHEMVDCLLKNGADVNVRYDPEISPFVTAVRLEDTDMVRALAKLEPEAIDDEFSHLGITALHIACLAQAPKILELLLKYGGDVNLKCDTYGTIVHEAVALGNGEMLRVLAELGANLNHENDEGVGLINFILTVLRPMNLTSLHGVEKAEIKEKAMIKLLVEYGIDLNQCYNGNTSPLHDAVRLGDLGMAQILTELEVNARSLKFKVTPLFRVVLEGRTDLVRYFAENGCDVNGKFEEVTPLLDAVCRGDVDMVRLLITYDAHHRKSISSAGTESTKNIDQHYTALEAAIMFRSDIMVKCLLECGADANYKGSFRTSALHEAVEKSDLVMIDVLTDGRFPHNITEKIDLLLPLRKSILLEMPDITETLLKHGADMNCLQHIAITPLDVALDQGKVGCALLLISRNVIPLIDTIGSSPLHFACEFGHIDLARNLIIAGSDVRKRNKLGRKPLDTLEYLLRYADYHVLQEAITATKVTEQVLSSSVSTSGCQDMKTSLHTPGIGDVKYMSSPSATEISQRVNQLLISTIQQCKAFPGKRLIPIGSSAEGTRVGLPNEMDFLFPVGLAEDEERTTEDLGNGYAKYMYDFRKETIERSDKNTTSYPDLNLGSAFFHNYIIEEVMNEVFVNLENTVSYEKVSIHPGGSMGTKDTDRKACSTLRLIWNDSNSSFLLIPVDIVPSVHIDNWPEGAITRTWLMGENELRSRGYVLVPKPPHVKSDLAKEFTEEELQTLWNISFPHLETEHMQRLEHRVKDVYITAKCLKNPDVCRIMITDDGSLPRSVGKYVTSYMLKMCFLKNVEYFRKHHMSLEEMVCKVYDDLVLGLSKNFIPLFFLPKVSALSGIKVDVPKSFRVAKIMARFVRALYLRDSLGDITDGGDDLVMTVYQRNPSSVYRVYDISTEDD